ncbi:hypothetical protein VCR12J2_1380206 [Vibrio coralliirubri]|uniref:glycosyltransferase family 4 protein n=1 Tax=Vibrio coralliirubri TaxID=1516159 RepID=UPI000632780F|nr:glycosyltransferase family 4 protein [Vibrio coralliirubri]CDT89224.1 hypothetical protein VCR12J2_1380206 [Vibrio coralliirubri]
MKFDEVTHFINANDVRRGGAQRVLSQLLCSSSHVNHLEQYSIKNKVLVLTYQFSLLFIMLLLVKSPKVVIIHSRCFMPYLIVFKIFSVKTILYTHAEYRKARWLYKLFKSNQYIAVSNAVKESLKKEGISSELITVISNPNFEVDEFLPSYNEKITTRFASVGSLKPWKGFIEASSHLAKYGKKQKKEVEYFIVGEGPQRKYLEQMSHKERFLNVHCLGYSKSPFEILQDAPFIIIPSLEEGFGLIAIEAIYQNKIVIYSDIPALTEICKHDKLCFGFKNYSYKSFEKAVENALQLFKNEDVENYREIRKTWVVDNYGLDKFLVNYRSYLSNNFGVHFN